jgi:hypothetical protein
MRQKCSIQRPGSTDESRELVRFSTWLLACALLLQENNPHGLCKQHDPRHDQGKACDRAAGSRIGQTPRNNVSLRIPGL